jgi:murein L,D-transpeptidase YafK
LQFATLGDQLGVNGGWGVARLKRSTLHARLLTKSRFLAVCGIIAAAAALAGCETDSATVATARALRPLPSELAAEMEKKNMPKESPILVRLFKEEAEFEVWKQDANGQFALLKTYPICRWSGELGPKVKEGDRQAPEGFYAIRPGQMNPNSNYYLSFDLGFPNAYDRANDRTGAFLMVHGDCSSAGCYAMTDEQIQEIYALGRDSFLGGQKSFQVQAYPFRMTPLNLAKHRNNPNMAFWRMIKEGNDHFLVTRAEPKVDVCEKRYVFDADAAPGTSFHPREKCPAYQVNAALAALVKDKNDKDDRELEALANKGIATVAVRTGTDGGMHPTFLAKLRPQEAMFDNDGRFRAVVPSSIPLPANVNPPHAPSPEAETTSSIAAAEPAKPKVYTTASVAPTKPTIHAVTKPQPAAAKPQPHTEVAQMTTPAAPAATPPATPPPAASAFANAAPPAASSGLMTGATPVVPSGTFESRWGGLH